VARVAAAQATFDDGFEGRLTQFDTPAGVWDFIGLQFPNQSVTTSSSAAKRGLAGLRTVDNHRDAGADSQVVLGRNTTGSGTQYLRAWWRVTASNGVPANISFLMTQGNTSIGTLAETKWNPSTNEVLLVCFDRNGTFFNPSGRVRVPPDGGFHLVELAVQNLGSAGATCSSAFDGAERARQNIDHTGTMYRNVLVGPVYGETEWTGVMEYDDFAASPAPMASRLTLTPTAVTLGDCAPVTIQARSSFTTALAPVVTATAVTVRLDGGAVFLDAQCQQPLSTATTLAAGATTLQVAVRVVRPTGVSVFLDADDLVSSTQALVVMVRDGGVDAGSFDGGADGGNDVDAGADAGTVDGGGDGGVDDGGRAPADAGQGDGPDAGGAVTPPTADAGLGVDGPGAGEFVVGCGCVAPPNGLLLLAVGWWWKRRARRR
jgi:hypothetical protein